MSRRQPSSTLGELLAIIALPLTWLVRCVSSRRRAEADEIRRFYRSKEWKALRYTQLIKEPRCKLCGASAATGARMNVDHVRPLHRHWHLRLTPSNLQTLCASCNWGKGGK